PITTARHRTASSTSGLFRLSLHDALPILQSCIRPLHASHSAAGLDGIRGSACQTNGRAHTARIIPGPLPNPDRTGLPSRSFTLRSEEHTSELQSREKLVCRLLLEKKNKIR